MALVALAIIAVAGYGLSRVPTGFLPIEDQGYLLVTVQLPDGASLERTKKALDQVPEIARKDPGVDQRALDRRRLGARQQRDARQRRRRSTSCSNWDERGKDQQLLPCSDACSTATRPVDDARDQRCRRRRSRASAMPAASHAGAAARRHRSISPNCRRSPTPSSPTRSRRADCSGCRPRSAPTCRRLRSMSTASRRRVFVSVDQVFQALATYLGSSYVAQFNKFGRTFQVYVQADAKFRLRTEDIDKLYGAQPEGRHDPARHAGEDRADGRPVADQPLQSLSVVERSSGCRRAASARARRSR